MTLDEARELMERLGWLVLRAERLAWCAAYMAERYPTMIGQWSAIMTALSDELANGATIVKAIPWIAAQDNGHRTDQGDQTDIAAGA